MSATALPISPIRFAAAIESLPLDSLHDKAAELCNSLRHLVRSNELLRPLADEGDDDCADAVRENDEVMARYTCMNSCVCKPLQIAYTNGQL